MKKLLKKVAFYGQRQVKSYKMRGLVRDFQCNQKGKITIGGKSGLIPKEGENNLSSDLTTQGYAELPHKLSAADLKNILNFSAQLKLFDPFNPNFGDFVAENIPSKTHVANFRRKDLLNCPAILKIANDPGILRVVQNFLGCKPTISNVNMWWSKAGREKAKDAQLFHRDVDDIKFCKLFIYLTDVGPKDGPHTYVKNTSSVNKLTKIRRYQDAEIEDAFGRENIIDFVRPKGSVFLVDTYGFHKGTLPVENDRLLLQVQYSINPIGIEQYEPIPMEHGYHPYVNRLILK